MPLTDEKAAALAEIVDDLNERIATHTDAALDAIENVEANYEGWREGSAEDGDELETRAYYFADTDLRRAQVHAALALGLRLDILTQLLTVAALPGYDPPAAQPDRRPGASYE